MSTKWTAEEIEQMMAAAEPGTLYLAAQNLVEPYLHLILSRVNMTMYCGKQLGGYWYGPMTAEAVAQDTQGICPACKWAALPPKVAAKEEDHALIWETSVRLSLDISKCLDPGEDPPDIETVLKQVFDNHPIVDDYSVEGYSTPRIVDYNKTIGNAEG